MRLNVYGFLQFFRDFSNCFFSSLFVKNMPKHATRVKGAPGAFVREIRPINYDQPRLAPGPRHVVLGPGCAVRARIARAAGIGSRSRHQAPGTRHQGPGTRALAGRARVRGPGIAATGPGIVPGIVQACQGSRTRPRPRPRDRGPGIGYQGPRYAVRFQGFEGRPGRPGSAGDRIAQGLPGNAWDRLGIAWGSPGDRPGKKNPAQRPGFSRQVGG